jgi:hypothetical protein
MRLLDLVREWLEVEFPELSVHVLSEADSIGEILRIHVNHRLSFVVAYITEDEIVFGPNWGSATKIKASDPECFSKAKLLIQQIPYNEPYGPGKSQYKTM